MINALRLGGFLNKGKMAPEYNGLFLNRSDSEARNILTALGLDKKGVPYRINPIDPLERKFPTERTTGLLVEPGVADVFSVSPLIDSQTWLEAGFCLRPAVADVCGYSVEIGLALNLLPCQTAAGLEISWEVIKPVPDGFRSFYIWDEKEGFVPYDLWEDSVWGKINGGVTLVPAIVAEERTVFVLPTQEILKPDSACLKEFNIWTTP